MAEKKARQILKKVGKDYITRKKKQKKLHERIKVKIGGISSRHNLDKKSAKPGKKELQSLKFKDHSNT